MPKFIFLNFYQSIIYHYLSEIATIKTSWLGLDNDELFLISSILSTFKTCGIIRLFQTLFCNMIIIFQREITLSSSIEKFWLLALVNILGLYVNNLITVVWSWCGHFPWNLSFKNIIMFLDNCYIFYTHSWFYVINNI